MFPHIAYRTFLPLSSYEFQKNLRSVVLPEPVVAHAHRSLPSRATGIVVDWISVGCTKLRSFTAWKKEEEGAERYSMTQGRHRVLTRKW